MKCLDHGLTVVNVEPVTVGECIHNSAHVAVWKRIEDGTPILFCGNTHCCRLSVPETNGAIPEHGGIFCAKGSHEDRDSL